MKKLYMFPLLAATLCAGAVTAEFGPAQKQLRLQRGAELLQETAEVEADAPLRVASDELDYSLSTGPSRALGFNFQTKGTELAQAFEITPESATTLAGNTLTQITFYTGTNSLTKNNRITAATVFLTYDLTEEPFFTQEVECPKTAYAQVVAELTQPYTLEAGKRVFVGVRETVAHSKDLPIVVDYTAHEGDEGGWVAYKDEEGWAWDNFAGTYGFVCVGAVIKGNSLPHNNASLKAYSVSSSVVEAGKTFDTHWLITNNGADLLTSVKLRVTVGDLAPQDVTISSDKGFKFAQTALAHVLKLSYPTAKDESIVVKGEIVEVNGQPNTSTNAEARFDIDVIPVGAGFERNVVLEEFTGTWCPWCPVGIVVMEQIRENYPDGKFIPVTIHESDEMQSSSYIPVVQYSNGSAPDLALNRQTEMYPWPYNSVVSAAADIAATPAVVKVKATAEIDLENANQIKVHTVTNFANKSNNADSRFVLSFGVTEDYVGPYTQQNGYSGESGSYGGWEKLDSQVDNVMYNDIARYLDTFSGIEGSIPANVEPGVDYGFDHTITLPKVKYDGAEVDIVRGHCNIVVYVIEKINGAVHNACTVKAAQLGNNAGLDNVAVDNADAPVEYYTLQGVRVNEPANGIYIRRQGTQVSKIIR